MPVEILSYNDYNVKNQLVTKWMGKTNVDYLQKVDYTYNSLGWLAGINSPCPIQSFTSLATIGNYPNLYSPALAANNAIPKQKIVNAVLSGSMNSNGRGNVTNPSIQNVAPNGQAGGAAPIAGNGGGGNVGAGGVNGQNTIAVIGSGGGAANPTTIFTPNSNAPAADNRFDITASTSNNTVNTLNSLNTGQNPQQLNNTQLSFNQGLSVPAPTTTSPEEDSRRSATGAGQLSASDRLRYSPMIGQKK